MRDPESALAVKMQDELGLQEPAVTPLAEGVATGIATAVGALFYSCLFSSSQRNPHSGGRSPSA